MPEMQSKKLAGSKPSISTQRYIDISEIKDDVVILKDGTIRGVLLISSINFALKSEDEQQAIINQYISFMNSLDFPIQIVVQSRRLNIDNYLERLASSEKEQTNELLRVQIADYRSFVKELVTLGEIMSKSFFIVVPLNPVLAGGSKGFFQKVQEAIAPALLVRLAEEKFQKRKHDLMQRMEHVSGSLGSMGLKAQMLDTQSLIELYYNVYNPELFAKQKMTDTAKLRVSDDTVNV